MDKKRLSRLFVRQLSTSFLLNQQALKAPFFDIKHLKQNPDAYQDSIDRRRISLPDNTSIKDLINDLDNLSSFNKSRAKLVHERNVLQKQLNGEKTEEIRSKLSEIKPRIKTIEDSIKTGKKKVDSCLQAIPNLISPNCPNEEPEIVDMIHGDKKRPESSQYDHTTISSTLGIVDFDRASHVSGTSFYYFIEDGALLEQALIQLALSRARKAGWSFRSPPSLVRPDYTSACGFRPRDTGNEQQVYVIENSNLCLTGTAEIPLAGYFANDVIDLAEKPIRHVGVSRSFRAEAGSRGRDTKGLYRVHEFTKVELFAWTSTAESAEKMLEEIVEFQKTLVSDLGLCARVLNMPCTDLGNPAFKKYDIEAWMPGRGTWGEISSASNCRDYQSKRLNTKYKKGNDLFFAQTLNGTAMAIPRMILAILENFYDPATAKIEIPTILRPFMDNKMYIEKAI